MNTLLRHNTIRGVYTALITPFRSDGAIDMQILRALVDEQIDAGIDGLVPMGTTGESPTVSHDEQVETIAAVIEQSNGRVPVIAGSGSNATDEAISMTSRAAKAGASATLQVAPYYNKPNQEGFYRHFSAIADQGGLPVIIYNIPGRSAKNIDVDTIVRLARHENIIALKEASTDIAHIMDVIYSARDLDFTILSGNDNLAMLTTLLGGKGTISVASNLAPRDIAQLITAALDGDVSASRSLHHRLTPLFDALSLDTNPIPIKRAMALAGKIEECFRLPLCPMSENSEFDRVIRAILR